MYTQTWKQNKNVEEYVHSSKRKPSRRLTMKQEKNEQQ